MRGGLKMGDENGGLWGEPVDPLQWLCRLSKPFSFSRLLCKVKFAECLELTFALCRF